MSVPWIGARPTPPTAPVQSVNFLADCDLCGGSNATWQAVVSTAADYSRSKIDYTVICSRCAVVPPSVEEAKEIA